MKRGYDVGGRYSQDPVGSDESRGKNRERRKHKLDGPTLTPTEAHIKNSLMRQFMRNPEGEPVGEAYKSASCWCAGPCGGRRLAITEGLCDSCWWKEHPPADPAAWSATVVGTDADGKLVELPLLGWSVDANGSPIE